MSKKRILALAIVVVLVGGLLAAGCAAPTPAPAPAPAPAPVPAPAAPEEVFEWTMQGSFEPGDPSWDPVSLRWVNRLNASSGGRLKIEAFPGGAIVPASEETDGLMTGVLDAATCCGGYAMNLDPGASLFDSMSGGLTSVQLAYWFRAGGGYEVAREMYSQWGIYYAAEMLLCPEDWAYTTVKLETVSDLKKLKMRTAGYGGEILDRLGASTVFLPGGELYESMQRGVINAFEYMAAMTGWEMAFHEVSDYLYLSYSRAPSDGCNYLIRQESLDALPEDLQNVVRYVSENEMTYFYDSMIQEDAAYLEKWREYGVEVLPLPKEIEDAYIAESVKFFDDKIAEYGEASYFAKIVRSQRAFKALWESAGVH